MPITHRRRISNWLPEVFAYVKNGGVVIAQYNTLADLKTTQLGPYPLEISRDRVTDENAEVRVLAPNHPLMTIPNKITSKDFEGWVQERGLYFPNKWDPAWTPILSCNDPKEKPLDGGLLVAKLGKGFFIYTSYSWFRQLPAGVPGSLSVIRKHVVTGKMNAPDSNADARSWRKAYALALSLFAVEVVLLYLFTVRFS